MLFLGLFRNDLYRILITGIICYLIHKKRRERSVRELNLNTEKSPKEKAYTNILLCVPFQNNMHFAGDSICSIDLIKFNNGDPVILTPFCNHVFHPACIDEWLKSNRDEKRCPNCNSSLN